MGSEHLLRKMETFIKDIGVMIKRMEMEPLFKEMESKSLWENLRKIIQMEKDRYIHILMDSFFNIINCPKMAKT